ncbi:MAG: hypothetical protein L3J87_02110 [Thermoplasmata archaeon]|nr:hypothetical protein [Thermoplasmata archaeon]MCI4344405.1 hypothetical protein [Thermoplasmata archaeon]
MVLVVDWENLAFVALPFLTCLGISGLLAIGLYRVAAVSGVPHRRERCLRCRFVEALHRSGTCHEPCAVNQVPQLPAVLFVATCTFALLFLFFPTVSFEYVIPFEFSPPDLGAVLLGFLAAANFGGSVVLAAYLLQDRAVSREMFNRVAAFGAVLGILLGLAGPAWVRGPAIVLTPVALAALLLGVGLEYRARLGRPAVGLRAVGAATLPLFLLILVASARLVQLLLYARPIG